MVNRWKTQRKITYGCAFGLCVALACCSFFSVPASAVLFQSLTSASASDYLVNHDGISWTASNGIATAMPLVPGQEVVGGAEGTSFLSQGPASYDSQQVLDARDIIQFQSEKAVKWDRLGTMYDSVSMFGMNAPLDDTSTTCSTGFNVTGTNEFATQFASTIGGSGEYHGLNVVTQLDSETPDTLDSTMALQGKSGSGTIGFSSTSLIGFANTTQPMWKNSVDQRISGGGATFSIGKQTKWRSFMNIFNSTYEEQTTPAA